MKQFVAYKWIIFVFLFPIILLLGMVGLNEYYFKTSQTVVLPVEGYDPRDLLSGHYLIYKVNYGLKCPVFERKNFKTRKKSSLKAYMCFQPEKQITFSPPSKNCTLFIKGHCGYKREFLTKVDRFYVPESKAQELEQLFMSAKEKKVVLSVTKKGHTLAKDILIDGKSVRDIVRSP